jgi:predicted ribosome quality control (RQC) complex YloA/Tae2 family protein
MKQENVFIQPLKREIIYYIGKNKDDNFKVIDAGKSDDLWFHAENESSSHIVCIVPDDIDKSDLKYIIKVGALLCKNNTNKLKSQKNVEIIYTQIKNVIKTAIAGCVQTTNTKTIII